MLSLFCVTTYLLLILSLLFKPIVYFISLFPIFWFILQFLCAPYIALFYYVLLSSIFVLIHFTLLCIISLRFTLLQALLSSFRFSSALQFTLFILTISPPFRSLYALFYAILLYFTLFSLHYIPVCFALLRFFTLPRFGLLRFVLSRFAFLFFFLVQFPLSF